MEIVTVRFDWHYLSGTINGHHSRIDTSQHLPTQLEYAFERSELVIYLSFGRLKHGFCEEHLGNNATDAPRVDLRVVVWHLQEDLRRSIPGSRWRCPTRQRQRIGSTTPPTTRQQLHPTFSSPLVTSYTAMQHTLTAVPPKNAGIRSWRLSGSRSRARNQLSQGR
jgi:hypothetical protein